MDYKRKAIDFLKEYKVQRINLEGLIEIIKSQGYQVIQFNTFETVQSTELLLEELELKQYSTVNKAFTFVQGSIKIVFIDDTLLDKDKLYALIHEEGHIYCGHMDRYTCSATNVEDEHEANEFAHYVLDPPKSARLSIFIDQNKKAITVIVLAIVLICAGTVAGINIYKTHMAKNNYVKTLEYFVTESGSKYHIEGCRYLKDAKGVRKITEEEFNSELYGPCKECIDY